MNCKNCGNAINENAAVCLKCGVAVGKGNKYCANCGALHDPLASICVTCGHSLNMNVKGYNSTNNEVVDSFGGAIKACFSKYASFTGRANRSEYWYFVLFQVIFCFIPFVNIVAGLVFLIPSIAVNVRRLHDIGKSGWNLLFFLIPIAGPILLLVWVCQPSQEGENQYGPNPNM